ncbi:uncharacterized protein [Amphiura filiformis]|uniref:uncharacterized protein n=1 Tax=Amphiura filiformis TaxID=82378 RepID=UPI003B227CB5
MIRRRKMKQRKLKKKNEKEEKKKLKQEKKLEKKKAKEEKKKLKKEGKVDDLQQSPKRKLEETGDETKSESGEPLKKKVKEDREVSKKKEEKKVPETSGKKSEQPGKEKRSEKMKGSKQQGPSSTKSTTNPAGKAKPSGFKPPSKVVPTFGAKKQKSGFKPPVQASTTAQNKSPQVDTPVKAVESTTDLIKIIDKENEHTVTSSAHDNSEKTNADSDIQVKKVKANKLAKSKVKSQNAIDEELNERVDACDNKEKSPRDLATTKEQDRATTEEQDQATTEQDQATTEEQDQATTAQDLATTEEQDGAKTEEQDRATTGQDQATTEEGDTKEHDVTGSLCNDTESLVETNDISEEGAEKEAKCESPAAGSSERENKTKDDENDSEDFCMDMNWPENPVNDLEPDSVSEKVSQLLDHNSQEDSQPFDLIEE